MSAPGPIVIKYGGSLLEDPEHRKTFLRDVAELSKRQPVVLVHGGGKEISRALKESGLPVRFVGGRRLTDEATMAVVDRVLSRVNAEIVDQLKSFGAAAQGFSGKSQHVVQARAIPELGRVGAPDRTDKKSLDHILAQCALPIFYSVASDAEGKPLNVNADDFALAIATACQSQRLVFLTDTGAILRKDGSPITRLAPGEAEELIADGTITGGMMVKVRACVQAVAAGVARVDIAKNIDEQSEGTGIY